MVSVTAWLGSCRFCMSSALQQISWMNTNVVIANLDLLYAMPAALVGVSRAELVLALV